MQDAPFPLYVQVNAEHVVPGMRQLLAELNAQVQLVHSCGDASLGSSPRVELACEQQ